MRTRACICITLLAFCHVRMNAQTLTTRLPPAISETQTTAASAAAPMQPRQSTTHNSRVELTSTPPQPSASSSAYEALPNAPQAALVDLPIAEPVPSPPTGVPITIRARMQEKHGDVYELRDDVEIDYQNYVILADRITYNTVSGDVVAEGHLQVTGGPDQEDIYADHGTLNLNKQTGRFYNVIGSIGVTRSITAPGRAVYTTPNPFLMTGKELIKKGPDTYLVIGGSMTSCRVPKPHWRILAPRILVDNGTGKAWNSNFRLFGFPIVYLPYVTHAVNASGRQSGFLIPVFSPYDNIKGTIIGGAYYWAISRSADLTVGLQYYSLRGFEQSAEFRYKGHGQDFIHGRYTGMEDRGLAPLYVNQGGQDTLIIARHDWTQYTRGITNAEYLSSYAYRQLFAPNFSQAISSEVKSWAFWTHEKNGLAVSPNAQRYENFASDVLGDEIRILHVPAVDFDMLDHRFGKRGFYGGGIASMAVLSRSEPYFRSHNVGRLDLFPHVSMPWIDDGWKFRPTLGLRETSYSHSQFLGPVVASPTTPPPSSTALPGQDAVPIPENGSLNRKAVEADVQVLPPVLERDFDGPYLAKRFGVALRHTIEPEVNYRYVAGVHHFNSVPRFDPIDVYSDTNEVEYGLTQRLFLKRLHPKPCDKNLTKAQRLEPQNKDCGEVSRQLFSWFVGQKYFADPTFGNAIIPGRRNEFATTLDFSGIAYITSPRNVSPIVSRLRFNPNANTDLEWDFDYDTKAGRVASSNVFGNYRRRDFFSSWSLALLNAVGETPVPPTQPPNYANYEQMQFLVGYGALTKSGFSAATSSGIDLNSNTLEYESVQGTYNFDCCGFTVEYRSYSLGNIRNENQVSFSFTLAGVGSAGNLSRATQLF